jgi:hypothetical protein
MAEGAPRVLGEVTSYPELIDVLRRRVNELNLLLGSLDRVAGFTESFSSHALARIPNKGILSPVVLENLLATLGLKLLVVEDRARLEKSRRNPEWQERKKNYVRPYRTIPEMFIAREAARLAAMAEREAA